jgi:hypothetical protein
MKSHVLLLKRAIYGLVQAVRQWWKKFKVVMATCDYYPSKSDPFLFIKKASDGEPISFDIIYVDHGGNIKTPYAIKEVIAALGTVFKVNTMGEMDWLVVISLIQ